MQTIGQVKVKSVKFIGYEDVYNMEVETHHNFSVNGGLIVHNCYDGLGYTLVAYHANKSKGLVAEKSDIEKHRERTWKQSKGNHRRR